MYGMSFRPDHTNASTLILAEYMAMTEEPSDQEVLNRQFSVCRNSLQLSQ